MSVENNQPRLWNINDIFTYADSYQEKWSHPVRYEDCELKVDFGSFKKGYICNISIDSSHGGEFTMLVDCDSDNGGELFVPLWTSIENVNKK